MNRLNKIETLEDLHNEQIHLEKLQYQNELLIKQEIADFKEQLKPVSEITSIFSKADNEEEKREKKRIIKKYAKITLPYLAVFVCNKFLMVRILSRVTGKFLSHK